MMVHDLNSGTYIILNYKNTGKLISNGRYGSENESMRGLGEQISA
jgi:hypothetical protein